MKENPPSKRSYSKKKLPKNNLQNRSQKQKIQNPNPTLTRAERSQRRADQKEKMAKSNPPIPPTPPVRTSPVQSTSSAPDSEAEKIHKMWTNLDNDFSFTGNGVEVLNKIKSFRFVFCFKLCIILRYVFSVHRPIRKNFTRRAVMIPSIFHTVFCDLIDYRRLKTSNNNFSYILVLIDAFSRYSWTHALKTKEAKECSLALDSILSTFQYRPTFFASGSCVKPIYLFRQIMSDFTHPNQDAGNEFNPKNKHIKNILIDKYNMKMYIMKGRTKGSIGKLCFYDPTCVLFSLKSSGTIVQLRRESRVTSRKQIVNRG